jgi:hypothetical protein
MHPMIKPGLRRGWRDRQTLQYGVAPAHAVLVGPVDDATAWLIDRMDGTRSVEQLEAAAAAVGLPAGTVEEVARRLAGAGVLEDATAHRAAAAEVRERLRPDLGSLSDVHAEPGGGLRRLAGRRAARLRVRGAGRVGAAVASVLSAAGVGQVEVRDGGVVEPWDTLPAGVPADQAGERRDTAANRAVHRASPWPVRGRRRHAAPQDGLSLVVIAPRDGLDAYAPDPALAESLVRTGVPHLYGGVIEGTGVIGPLVLPGVTARAECLLRNRSGREPTWPLVVGQWRTSGRRRGGTPPCDAALATAVAGAAAAHALAFLDGDGSGVTGRRQTLVLPHLRATGEEFTPHPECPCGAAASPPGGVEPAFDGAEVCA